LKNPSTQYSSDSPLFSSVSYPDPDWIRIKQAKIKSLKKEKKLKKFLIFCVCSEQGKKEMPTICGVL